MSTATANSKPTTHKPHDPSLFNRTPPTVLPFNDVQATNKQRLSELLKDHILFLDGAMGTEIQNYKLQEADYRGARFADYHRDVKGNNDLLVLTQPQIIKDIHRSYLDAGADIIETALS